MADLRRVRDSIRVVRSNIGPLKSRPSSSVERIASSVDIDACLDESVTLRSLEPKRIGAGKVRRVGSNRRTACRSGARPLDAEPIADIDERPRTVLGSVLALCFRRIPPLIVDLRLAVRRKTAWSHAVTEWHPARRRRGSVIRIPDLCARGSTGAACASTRRSGTSLKGTPKKF